jgi:hypothetical protein
LPLERTCTVHSLYTRFTKRIGTSVSENATEPQVELAACRKHGAALRFLEATCDAPGAGATALGLQLIVLQEDVGGGGAAYAASYGWLQPGARARVQGRLGLSRRGRPSLYCTALECLRAPPAAPPGSEAARGKRAERAAPTREREVGGSGGSARPPLGLFLPVF